jgi:uncharacterized protein
MEGIKMKIDVCTPTPKDLKDIDFPSWGTWECPVSNFPWHYDQKETCYITEGHVIVETKDQKVEFKKGDMVFFPKGLSCKWTVLEPVKKYYRFD